MSHSYPKRGKFYANKVARALHDQRAVASIGLNGCWFVTVIAMTEDKFGYKVPAKFWNGQLMDAFGFNSPKQLNDIRSKCVDAGWLHYERENDRSLGVYWSCIPKSESIPKTESVPESESFPESIPPAEHKAEKKAESLYPLDLNNPYPQERGGGEDIPEIPPMLSGSKFKETWNTYLKWVFLKDGKHLNGITAKFRLDDLCRREAQRKGKAVADLRLTMERAEKTGTIFDSDRSNSWGETDKPKWLTEGKPRPKQGSIP